MPVKKKRRTREEIDEALELAHQMDPKEAKAMRIALGRLEQIRNQKERVEYVGKLEVWDKQYRNKEVSQYYHGESNLFIPMTFETVETISTWLLAVLFFSDPCFKIKGFESSDIKLAEDVWTPFLKYQTTKRFSLEEKMEDAITSLVKYGTVAVKNNWKRNTKYIKFTKGIDKGTKKRVTGWKEHTLQNHPDLQIWPMDKVYFDATDPDYENFDFVAFEGESRLDQLLALDEEMNPKGGIYKHVKWLKDDYFKLKDSDKELTGQKDKAHLDKVKWVEIWWNYDKDNDGYAEECVMMIANERLVIRYDSNPHDTQFKPLLLCQLTKKEGSPYGIGVCEILEKLQIELNDTANQVMDNATFILNNMWIVDIVALDAAAAKLYCKNKQSGIIPVDTGGAPIDNVIRALEKPNIIEAGLIKMKMIREMGKDVTATPSAIQGMPSRYKPTATEFAGVQGAAVKKIQRIAKRLERKVLKPWLSRALELNYQYVERKDVIRVLGEKGVIYKDRPMKELRINCDFVPVGSLEIEDKAGRIQQLMYFMKIASTMPPEVSRVNLPVLLRKIWESFGPDYKEEAEQVFMKDPQKELIAPEDENVLLESGTELLPHIFDNHGQHREVHAQGPQTDQKTEHSNMHMMIAQQMAQRMGGGQGGVGPQELPQGGGAGEKAPGEVLGELKAPPVM